MMEGLIAAGLLAALFVVLWAKERAARSTVENRFRSVLDAEAEKQKVLGEKATLDREIERLRTDRDRRTTEDEALAAERRRNLATALDATRQKAEAEIAEAKRQAELKTQAWQTEYARAQEDLRRLQAELGVLTDDAEMQSFGLYKPLYDFAKSTQYKDRLEEVREKQRAMVTNETAAVCPMQWEVSGSKVEGRKMIAR